MTQTERIKMTFTIRKEVRQWCLLSPGFSDFFGEDYKAKTNACILEWKRQLLKYKQYEHIKQTIG